MKIDEFRERTKGMSQEEALEFMRGQGWMSVGVTYMAHVLSLPKSMDPLRMLNIRVRRVMQEVSDGTVTLTRDQLLILRKCSEIAIANYRVDIELLCDLSEQYLRDGAPGAPWPLAPADLELYWRGVMDALTSV